MLYEGAGGDSGLQFINIIFKCGICGADNAVLHPAVLVAIEGKLRAMLPTALAAAPKLVSTVDEAKAKQEEPGKLWAELQEHFPDFAWIEEIKRLAKPTNPGEFWTLITAIVAVVSLFVSLRRQSPTTIINNYHGRPKLGSERQVHVRQW